MGREGIERIHICRVVIPLPSIRQSPTASFVGPHNGERRIRTVVETEREWLNTARAGQSSQVLFTYVNSDNRNHCANVAREYTRMGGRLNEDRE